LCSINSPYLTPAFFILYCESMNRLKSVLTILFQIFISYSVLLTVYFVYALSDIDDLGFYTLVGFLLFQPLFAFLLVTLTIVIGILIGLPIRLNYRVRVWWYTKPLISIFGAAIGLILLGSALLPFLREIKQINIDGVIHSKQIPNLSLAVSGWFITAFCLLHFFPESLKCLLKRWQT
jgi:hypothetical protein